MDDLKVFARAAFGGFLDGFKGQKTVFCLDKELNRQRDERASPTHSNSPIRRRQSKEHTPVPTQPKKENNQSMILTRICQCGLLNGAIFLTSILLFEYGFMPSIETLFKFLLGKDSSSTQAIWSWVKVLLEVTFQTVWVVPLFAISKFINNLWFQDIGQSVFKYSRGRSSTSLSISKTVADFIFSSVVETLFLLQALLVSYIPYIGYVLYIIHLSLLYSLYAFEYKWGEMGWEIHKRLTCIETHWAYFFGFGLPLAVFTQVAESWIINGCIFSMLFPLFIISANGTHPPREHCFRIQIFTPVIAVSNAIFSVLGKEKKGAAQRPVSQPRR